MNFTSAQDNLAAARILDKNDPLSRFRQEFVFPKNQREEPLLYFAGHSLGLMPRRAKEYVLEELDAWGTHGVEGHFEGKHPWLPYHENLTESLARLVGAKISEVVAMNSLTTNLHLMMVSFYRPTKQRYKILIEKNTFPSDKYAVDSQARFHGFDPGTAIVELNSNDSISDQIAALGETLALVMLGNCNYLSGEQFPFETIVSAAHSAGAIAGFNLAHGAGNLQLKLHDWNVDFAVWCSYKYLNAGPGAIAGTFVHEKHLGKKEIPRFEGWWGHNKQTRFKMGPTFDPLPTVEAWQLSNPPILQLASLRASLSLFDEAGIESLRQRGDRLTSYLERLLQQRFQNKLRILTPQKRGSMLCLQLPEKAKEWVPQLHKRGARVDFREPNILRVTPAPLYNSFEDCYHLAELLSEVANG